jgi:hypothetical protein
MRRRAKPHGETWPETSDPYLEEVLSQDVLPRFPELKHSEFRIRFGSTPRDALAQVATWSLRQRGRVIRQSHLITISSQGDWSREEHAALMAHEAGHLVNELKGIRPKGWHERELAATSQAVARGFLAGFQHLFRRLCQSPCWREVARLTDGRVVARVQGRNLAGLYCIGGRGPYRAYCPFAGSLGPGEPGWQVGMQETVRVRGACALCKRALTKKESAYKCSGCSMLFHKACVESYLKRGQGWCPSCHYPLAGDAPVAPLES